MRHPAAALRRGTDDPDDDPEAVDAIVTVVDLAQRRAKRA
jgi:hypothetical protein